MNQPAAPAALSVAGLVLAGGRSARMGGGLPKPLQGLGGRALIDHGLARLVGHVDPVLISANDRQPFARFGLPVVADRQPDFAGPLAGLDAAAAWLAENRPGVTHMLALPGDTPFLPADVARTLCEAAGARVRVARHAGRLHPTVAVWPLAVLAGLPGHLATATSLSILRFLEKAGFEAVDFPDDPAAPSGDPFFNVNTPADLALAMLGMAKR